MFSNAYFSAFFHEIAQNQVQQLPVRLEALEGGVDVEHQLDRPFRAHRFEKPRNGRGGLPERDRPALGLLIAVLDVREVQQIRDHLLQTQRVSLDHLGQALPHGRVVAALEERLDGGADRSDRRSQLVARVGDEVRLEPDRLRNLRDVAHGHHHARPGRGLRGQIGDVEPQRDRADLVRPRGAAERQRDILASRHPAAGALVQGEQRARRKEFVELEPDQPTGSSEEQPFACAVAHLEPAALVGREDRHLDRVDEGPQLRAILHERGQSLINRRGSFKDALTQRRRCVGRPLKRARLAPAVIADHAHRADVLDTACEPRHVVLPLLCPAPDGEHAKADAGDGYRNGETGRAR